jgi:CheY-like chemotaxis protein
MLSQLARSPVILVVDDETVVREVVRRALEREGFQVLVAGSGAEALDMCQACEVPIDLAVLDVVMPVMDGIELLRCLRGRFAAIPVLFTSADWRQEELLATDLAPADRHFMAKPFTAQELVRRVKDELMLRRSATA